MPLKIAATPSGNLKIICSVQSVTCNCIKASFKAALSPMAYLRAEKMSFRGKLSINDGRKDEPTRIRTYIYNQDVKASKHGFVGGLLNKD